ncbi:MAG: DUF4185 domain-containing protein [Draconibacterium sp.]
MRCNETSDDTDDIVKVSIDKEEFSTEDQTEFTVTLSFENIKAIDRLEIRKTTDGSSSLYKTIGNSELTSETYTFTYNLLPEDYNFDAISFKFNAMKKDGLVGGSASFKINNKFGIYVSNLKQIARVTGNSHPNDNGLANPNNTCADYDVCGTDLGIIWEMGNNNVGLFFGDTFGEGFEPYSETGGGSGGNWRSNVLAFSKDSQLDDGLTISSMATNADGKARKIALTTPGAYNTSIPTSAIRVNSVDYVHYMNIYDWSGPNMSWLTHFSSLFASSDNGNSWERVQEVTFPPGSKFSQIAYGKKDGYVYMIGTLSGRGSAAWLARIPTTDMINMNKYEYWNGNTNEWVVGDESQATEILPARVGEASLIYHEKYERWILTYNKEPYGIVYRDTKDITDWSRSREKDLVVGMPGGVYCAYIHPRSSQLDKMYFIMSI